jgi:hypothetical protein
MTYLSSTGIVPYSKKGRSISDLAEGYLGRFLPGREGLVRVRIIRLDERSQKMWRTNKNWWTFLAADVRPDIQ